MSFLGSPENINQLRQIQNLDTNTTDVTIYNIRICAYVYNTKSRYKHYASYIISNYICIYIRICAYYVYRISSKHLVAQVTLKVNPFNIYITFSFSSFEPTGRSCWLLATVMRRMINNVQ